MRIAIVMLALLLAGCATTANFEKILQDSVGRPEADLIQAWGPPSSVYESGESKYLTWQRGSSGYVPGVAPTYRTYAIGNTLYTQPTGGSPGFAYTNHCKYTLELVRGVVRSWRWEGNACRA